MSGSSQIQEEATAMALRNVRTMYEQGKMKTALHRTPEGERRRGHPKITWRWTVEKEMQQMGKTWSSISVMAKERQKWRDQVAALHAIWRNGHE